MSKKARKDPFLKTKKRVKIKGKVSANTGNLWELLDRMLACPSDTKEIKKKRQLKSSLSGTSGKRLQNLGIKFIELE